MLGPKCSKMPANRFNVRCQNCRRHSHSSSHKLCCKCSEKESRCQRCKRTLGNKRANVETDPLVRDLRCLSERIDALMAAEGFVLSVQ